MGKGTLDEWHYLASLEKASEASIISTGRAANDQLENKMPAVPSSEAKVPICKNPDALNMQEVARPQDHSHASNQMSSSSSQELITQPGV